MIYNRSGHPIEIKKISIRLWTLRDEIEAAIERRIKECEAAGVPLFVDDIKRFYNLNVDAPLTNSDNVLPFSQKEVQAQEGLNSLMESIGEDVKAEDSPLKLCLMKKPLQKRWKQQRREQN